MYGLARRFAEGSRPEGGISVNGSSPARYRAKPRTTANRSFLDFRPLPWSRVANSTANLVVIRRAFLSFMNATSWRICGSWRRSLKPRLRRIASTPGRCRTACSFRTSWPGTRDRSQRLHINLRIDRGGLRVVVAQELSDFLQRRPTSKHGRREAMAEHMGARSSRLHPRSLIALAAITEITGEPDRPACGAFTRKKTLRQWHRGRCGEDIRRSLCRRRSAAAVAPRGGSLSPVS